MAHWANIVMGGVLLGIGSSWVTGMPGDGDVSRPTLFETKGMAQQAAYSEEDQTNCLAPVLCQDEGATQRL